MSSVDRDHISGSLRSNALSSELQPSISNNKKKFGKNLNKLTKPPPPPPNASSSISHRDSSGKGSSSQGLLLLSTKRGSSSSNTAGGVSVSPSTNLLSKLSGGTAATSSSSTPRPFNTPSLKSLVGSSVAGTDNGSTAMTSGWKTTPPAPVITTPVTEVMTSSSVPWKLGGEKNVADFTPLAITSGNDHLPKSLPLPSHHDFAPRVVPKKGLARGTSGDDGGNFVYDAPTNSRQNQSMQSDLILPNDTVRSGIRFPDNAAVEKHEIFSESLSGADASSRHRSKVAKELPKDTADDEEPKISTAERIRAQRRLKTLEEKQITAPSISLISQLDSSPISSQLGKKATSTTPHPASVLTPILTPHVGKISNVKRNEISIILEPLNRPRGGDVSKSGVGNNEDDRKDSQLIKSSSEIAENDLSNRTYSSLLGGSIAAKKMLTADVFDQQENHAAQKEDMGLPSTHQQIRPGSMISSSQQLYNPYKGQEQKEARPTGNVTLDVASTSPLQSVIDASPVAVIHLSSYDDQDRGERNRASSGPRMLFDPKSGSLVEARPRESRRVRDKAQDEKNDTGAVDNGRGKVERKGKSTRDRVGNDREKEKQSGQSKIGKDTDFLPPKKLDATSEPDQSSVNEADRKNNSKKQQRREVVRKQPLGASESKRAGKGDRSWHGSDPAKETLAPDKSTKTTLPTLGKKNSNDQNNDSTNHFVSRTIGDLHKKSSGNKALVNGSEEIVVVVGKITDSLSSPKFQDKRSGRHHAGEIADKLSCGQGLKKSAGKRGEYIAPRQPEHTESAKSQRKNDLQRKDRRVAGVRNSTVKEYDKARPDASTKVPIKEFDDDFNLDDNLLLEDDPDSPTLKATADAWRPSEAALRAAAAAAKSGAAAPDGSANKKNVADDEESESDIPFLGLGFDPTLNMDAVMMSPSLRSEVTDDEPLGFNSLSLGPSNKTPVNPFSALSNPNQFLGSSTWGGGSLHANAASLGLDWDNLLGTTQNESKSSPENAGSSGAMKKASSNTFLSLSPLASSADGKSTWGSGTFGGQLGTLRSSMLGGFDRVEKK